MLPGTGPAIEAASQAAGEGADALVVGSPYYFGVDAAAQERHIGQVLAAAPLPALLYNIPQCTHHVLPPATVRALARASRGCSASRTRPGDFEAFRTLLAIKQERPQFRVLQGHESLAAASLLQGADGMVPGLANVVPALFVELQAAVDRGDGAGGARAPAAHRGAGRAVPAGALARRAQGRVRDARDRQRPPRAAALARDPGRPCRGEGAARGGGRRGARPGHPGPVKLQAVIFDMDGVLVDSEPFGFEALRRVMARHGLPYGEEENAEFLGRTTLDSCRILRARHGLPESEETLADRVRRGDARSDRPRADPDGGRAGGAARGARGGLPDGAGLLGRAAGDRRQPRRALAPAALRGGRLRHPGAARQARARRLPGRRRAARACPPRRASSSRTRATASSRPRPRACAARSFPARRPSTRSSARPTTGWPRSPELLALL